MTARALAPIIVVGAGPSGLGAATALAATRDVVVVDRIPVPGGDHGWDSGVVRDQVRRAERAGVRLRLGAAALQWDGSRVLLAEPGSIGWEAASALVYAGGLRPATASDVGLVGDRPAGVLPATVAAHLLETGVALWRRPVVVGTGPWAEPVAERIRAHGGVVVAVVPPGESAPWADRVVPADGVLSVRGRDRVQALRVGTGPEIACDAVILAGDPRPNRNVDGAVEDGAPGVLFVQPASPHDPAARHAAAHATAVTWLQNGGSA